MLASNQLTRRGFMATSAAIATMGTARAAKDNWQIGIYTRPWADQDYRVALDAIAEAGFKYAGFMTTNTKERLVISASTPIEKAIEAGNECKQRGLKVPSAYGGGIPVNESLEAGIEGMKRLINNCKAAGVGNLLMGGISKPDLYDAYYKAIAETCDYAAEKGIGISIKPHGGLNATGPQVKKTIELVGNKNFRVWYDPGNIFFYSNAELNPIDDAPSVDGLVVGMAVKDYIHPKNVQVTPGTGMVDFPKVMAKLKAGGFTGGPLIIECLAPGGLKQTLEEAKKARKFVEQLAAE